MQAIRENIVIRSAILFFVMNPPKVYRIIGSGQLKINFVHIRQANYEVIKIS
jgi:hypothetical protein